MMYRVEQKNLAKFSDTCSVRADGLCIGNSRLVRGRKAGNSNMQDLFCTTLYFFPSFLSGAALLLAAAQPLQ